MTRAAVHNLATKPTQGVVTWDSEGAEGGRYHSRKLHVPSESSGLTIGRGYDMAHRHSGQIVNDLTRSGVGKEDAERIAKAAGKTGAAAKAFIAQNHLEKFEISQAAQLSLFRISYQHEENEVKRISSKADVAKAYGATDWNKVDRNIKDIVVDLKFRGDYTRGARERIQQQIAKNDLRAFAREICNRDNWKNVPKDRFDRRKRAMEAAVAALDKQERIKDQSHFRASDTDRLLGWRSPLRTGKGVSM